MILRPEKPLTSFNLKGNYANFSDEKKKSTTKLFEESILLRTREKNFKLTRTCSRCRPRI